jgi:phosphopantothenoylcysteine decarboxylase/phosphopantothenate--cysteine ligase
MMEAVTAHRGRGRLHRFGRRLGLRQCRPRRKIKKTSDSMVLALSRTRTSSPRSRPFRGRCRRCGHFDVERNALAKLEGKRLDMIAANQVGDGLAFDCEDNALTVYWPGGRRELARAPKRQLADELIAVIAERLAAAGRAAVEPARPAPGNAAAR